KPVEGAVLLGSHLLLVTAHTKMCAAAKAPWLFAVSTLWAFAQAVILVSVRLKLIVSAACVYPSTRLSDRLKFPKPSTLPGQFGWHAWPGVTNAGLLKPCWTAGGTS